MKIIHIEEDTADNVGMMFKDIPMFSTMTKATLFTNSNEIFLKVNTTQRIIIYHGGQKKLIEAIINRGIEIIWDPPPDQLYFNINRFALIDTTCFPSPEIDI